MAKIFLVRREAFDAVMITTLWVLWSFQDNTIFRKVKPKMLKMVELLTKIYLKLFDRLLIESKSEKLFRFIGCTI